MVPLPRPGRASVGLLLAFAALSLLFMWRLWAPNSADRAMIGAPDGDFARQFYPYRVFVSGAWAQGRLPMWNPHQYAGTPAWADPQQAVVYPWRLLQVPLAIGGRTLPMWAVELEAVMHLALGAWFTVLLLRRLGTGGKAAVVAGLTFAFGGYLTGYPIEQLAVLDTAVWVPAVLWALTAALDAAAEGRGGAAVRWALGAAFFTTMMAVAGHPQTAMYGLYFALAWCVVRAWAARVRPRRLITVVAVWLLLAAGLSAVQWLPAWEMVQRSARDFSAREIGVGLTPGALTQLVAPARPEAPTQLGGGDVSLRPGPGTGAWVPLYVGVLALALVLWAAARDRATWFWLSAAGAAWLVALGANGPLFTWLYRFAPGVSMFRHQERAAVVFSLALAVAAGLAFQRLADADRRTVRAAAVWLLALAILTGFAAALAFAHGGMAAEADALVISCFALGAGAAIAFARAADRLSARHAGWALLTVVVVELFTVNHGRVLWPRADVFAADPIVTTLQARAREGRVSSEALLPGGANAASVYGLYDVTGDSPMQLGRYAVLDQHFPELVSWRLLNVRFVVSDRAFPDDAPVREIARAGDRVLYEVQLPVPPTWVAVRSAADRGDEPWVPAPDFDPQAQVVVQGADAPAETQPGAVGESGTVGQARLVGLDPGHAVVEATLDRPGDLVLSTIYDPGWRATARHLAGESRGEVEGETLAPAVTPAYGVLPSVALPAGEWEVEWTYRPIGLSFGAALSGASLLLGVIVWRLSSMHSP